MKPELTMDKKEWLRALEKLTDTSRRGMEEPFVFDEWTMATNGYAALAVRGSLTARECPFQNRDTLTAMLGGFDPAVRLKVDVLDVRGWAGEVNPPCPDCTPEDSVETCSTCGGQGDSFCECYGCGNEHLATCEDCHGRGVWCCDTCDGEGVLPMSSFKGRVGSVHGIPVNKALWAVWAGYVPPGTATVLVPDDPTQVISVQGEGWRAAVMPLRGGVLEKEEAEPIPSKQVA